MGTSLIVDDRGADSTLQPYADHYFEYDPVAWRVTQEISAVCPTCPGGGTTLDQYYYYPNTRYPANGYNTWAMKTQQILPDSSQIVVYTNYIGQAMLKVNIDPTGDNMWGTFYYSNTSNGQVTWQAMPSAVMLPASLATLEAYDDLLNFNSTSGTYQYLNNSAGLINILNYNSSGNLLSQAVQQGQTGTPVETQSFTYTTNTDSSGNTISFLASTTTYPIAGNTSTGITTSYAYTWFSGTNQVETRTTTPPVIGTGQNGPGTLTPALTVVDEFDNYGNLVQRTDERGFVNTYAFDVVQSRMTEQVLNFNTSGSGPGYNLTTDYTYDDQGRMILMLGPSHTVVIGGTATTVRSSTSVTYIQSVEPGSGTWGLDQTQTSLGYATGSGPYTITPIDPATLVQTDKDGRVTDNVQTPNSNFNQSGWLTWNSTQFDDQHRTISSRVYFLIPSSGTGAEGTNYGETDYGYDQLERRNCMNAPGGTITRTVWTCPQNVLSVWVGTNDTGWTYTDPSNGGTPPNNMVMVTSNIYDNGTTTNPGGSGGDGNLVQRTQYVSATSGDTRVTSFAYDFRDRQIGMTDPSGRYTAYTLDNLNRLGLAQQYNVSGGTLINQSGTSFDDLNRIYQTATYAVNTSNGAVGNALTGNMWYDYSGNLIQKIAEGDGEAFSKFSYNGVNWVTGSYRGFNTTGTSYNQAGGVTTDIIVTQSIPTFDGAGNVISQAMYDRLNDASTSTTGALTGSIARVSYTANWFDGLDRNFANGNYGAVGGSGPSIPSTPPSSSSNGSTPVLLTQTVYNTSSGRVDQTIDASGIITAMTYDAANRTTAVVEDAAGGGLQRTTNTTYTLDNLVATLEAVNSVTGNQTTTYTYGTSNASSGVVRNDLLASVTYPDSVSGSDIVSYTYNRQSEQLTIKDQRGNVRSLYRDVLGRQTNDCVTTITSGTDTTVLQIATAYEIRGMVSAVTSYNNASQGVGTVVNQVQLTFNMFSQLIKEQQSHSGAVGGSTPSVQYGYDDGSENEIRMATLTYPNGRIITNSFGTSGGMNDYLNRIDTIQDTTSGTTNLADYAYLGSGTAVRITYPQSSVWLDLWGGTSGTFNGLDQFNRITDQRWQNNVTGTPADVDRYQYGYDFDSNRLWKGNVVAHAASVYLDEAYTYDHLNRLTEMQRGNLSSGSITGTPVREMDYTLDPTGNWPAYVTKTTGTTDVSQTRTSNTVNEITAINTSTGTIWVTPTYDAAGNTTTMPLPEYPNIPAVAVYDAWNRMVSLTTSGGTLGTYQYDGQGRRIVKNASSQTRHFFYTSDWQDVEERVGTATTMDQQYVWGVRYIDELVCRDDATPERLYATQDANFNLTGISNTSGGVVERGLFDPYGNPTPMNASWGAIAPAYNWYIGHQGLMHDAESGLVYNRARLLSPTLGSFLSRDPIGDTATLNRWKLAEGNELMSSVIQEATRRIIVMRGAKSIYNPAALSYAYGLNLYEAELSSPTCGLDPSGNGLGVIVRLLPVSFETIGTGVGFGLVAQAVCAGGIDVYTAISCSKCLNSYAHDTATYCSHPNITQLQCSTYYAKTLVAAQQGCGKICAVSFAGIVKSIYGGKPIGGLR